MNDEIKIIISTPTNSNLNPVREEKTQQVHVYFRLNMPRNNDICEHGRRMNSCLICRRNESEYQHVNNYNNYRDLYSNNYRNIVRTLIENSLHDNNLHRNNDVNLDFTITPFKNLNTQVEHCSICQEKFNPDDNCSVLTCQHVFHHSCIDEWSKYKQQCPLCRHPF